MAVIRIQAQKDARCMQAVYQIHGDRRTQILRFDVNRFDGGVDLGGLRWVIKTTNALGVEDIFDPEAVEIKERTISVDWLVDGSVTDATGIAGYELNGIDTAKDGQPVQWSGGLGSISVRAGKGPKFGETDGMTNIEKLILYVEGELQSVIDAGDAAAAAAERANRAADNIEDVAGTIARADAAAQRATQAAEAVEDLEGAVNRANAAAASANNAVTDAEMAASNAYSAANRAKEAADAVENITEAVTAAHEAAETANNAAATANEAALPHVVLYGTRVHGETAKVTGAPVTFLPDAGSLLQPVTVLKPKQAGSGNPYPAGSGKNKICLTALDSPTVSNVTVNELGTNAIKITTTATGSFQQWRGLLKVPESWRGKTFTFSVGEFERDYSDGEPYAYAIETPVPYAEASEEQKIYNSIWNFPGKVTFTIASTTVDIAIFFRIDKTRACPVGKYARWGNIQLEEGSTVTAFEPGENIRSITGYDALNLNRAGKNMIPYYNFSSDYSDGGVTVTINADKTLTFSGTATRDAYFYLSTYSSTYTTGYVFPTCEYALSGCPAGGSTQSYRMSLSLYKDGVWQTGGCTDTGSGGRFTVPEGHKVDLYIRFTSGTNANGVTFKPMIRLASIADDTYEPYQNTTYTAQIGQTVYGGEFDWFTGKLTLTHKYIEYGGDATFYAPNTGLINNGEIIRVTPLLEQHAVSSESEQEVFCNLLPHIVGGWNGTTAGPHIYILTDYSDTLALLLPTAIYGTTEESVKAKLAETPLQVAYKLVTPIEIQLTPHIISAADPEQNNTLYGDGNIEVEYVKPLHVSIEERVAAAVAAAMNAEGV